MASPRPPVTPSVLRWARESAGIDLQEAARRVPVAAHQLEAAEEGRAQLTLNQARKAASIYDRPFAVFFLPEAPREEALEVQFRRLRDAPPLPWAPEMRALARRIPTIQDQAQDLFEVLEERPTWPRLVEAFTTAQSDIQRLADTVRELLHVSLTAQQTAARGDLQGFKHFRLWREALEETGVLVLQDGSLTLDEMRGYAAPHPRVPAIVINTKDHVRARVYTMMHELAHLFGPAGLTEQRADEFAAALLMPSEPFTRDFNRAAGPTLLERIDATARLYGVTSDATAVRVALLRLRSWDDIQAVRDEIRARGEGKPGRGGDHYRNVVARLGPGFVTRVLTAVGDHALSELAAARLLDVRVDGLTNVRQQLSGAPDAR